MHQAWSELCLAHQQRRSVASVVGRLWDALGGSAGIARVWSEALKEASAVRRVRACEGLCRLTEWLAKHPEAVTGASELSDEALLIEAASARAAAFVELLQSDPTTAADLARRCGFSLETLTNSIDKPTNGVSEAV